MTDNYNKLMNRCWYCIAHNTGGAKERDVFYEDYFWRKKGETAVNHTKDRVIGKPINDYGHWNMYIKPDGKLYMQPCFKILCGAGAPVKMQIKTLTFPENDRRDQFWLYFVNDLHITKDGQSKFDTPLVFIFALTPNPKEEDW